MLEEDFIRSLGLPFLAHRLHRAMELIMEASSLVRPRYGFKGPARSASTLLLLREFGPTGITEIAYRLRLSHPVIIKLTGVLADAGLVRNQTDPSDSRRRLIALTKKGLAEAALVDSYSRAVARTLEAMFAEKESDLFAALERFEEAAGARSIAHRLEGELAKEFSPS